MPGTTIGQHLRNRRIELGLEQRQLAEHLGFALVTIGTWERGVCRPTKRAMEGILAFLGYDPRE